MQKLQHEAPPCVRKVVRGARDYWMIMDASEAYTVAQTIAPERRSTTADWQGGNFNQCLEMCRTGDNSVVSKSDDLLSEMANYMPQAQRRGFAMDVSGAVPDVPSFLSGNPLNMRRRIRIRDEYAPIAIVYDPTCSANISHSQIFKRGIVVLALVRALAGLRPIELWVAGGLNAHQDRHGAYFAMRIETAPLDLARAAHFMTSAMLIRGIGYNLLHTHFNAGGGWPYKRHDLSLSTYFTEIVRTAMPHVSDVLAIPGIHSSDELLNDPRGWLRRTFLELTNQDERDAA